MNEKKREPRTPPAPPIEFAGEWVAWNRERTEIIAHGKDLIEVHAQAKTAGHPKAILQKVHKPDLRFIGRL